MRVLLGLCRPVDGSRCSAVDSRLQAGWTPTLALEFLSQAVPLLFLTCSVSEDDELREPVRL